MEKERKSREKERDKKRRTKEIDKEKNPNEIETTQNWKKLKIIAELNNVAIFCTYYILRCIHKSFNNREKVNYTKIEQ